MGVAELAKPVTGRPKGDRRGLTIDSARPSLRAKRSNPEFDCGDSLDCFVAFAPRNDVAS
jgi:hypothetical protein